MEKNWEEQVLRWKRDVDQKVFVEEEEPEPIPCILLANKIDLAPEFEIEQKNYLDKFCQENGFLNWFPTSAKDDVNIGAAAKFIVGEILRRYPDMCRTDDEERERDEDVVDVRPTEEERSSNSTTCCG
eukprot:CAMPEP_0119156662 /NCGR_PEP_ID=MMETSP1310-20130426/52371_1 /TAXON_ID=464262 /ORGANISM="Genus nov. species nov., Strain RCC2339" /LENGTH=127 /DNA_ID=CAMNT_0007149277 /DNA_START=476 /DNA_END=859 /DNA_ORIENTATION=+